MEDGRDAIETWQPVTRGKVHVAGPDPRQPGHLDVRIPLIGSQPSEWVREFEAPARTAVPAPKVKGFEALISPPDSQLEAYVADVDRRIAYANTEFQLRILPQIQAALAQARAERATETERIESARRRAEGL